MSDLQKYIKKRKSRDLDFAENNDPGYEQFKIGVILEKAREEAGLSQAELATKLNTKKIAISRILAFVKITFRLLRKGVSIFFSIFYLVLSHIFMYILSI